MKRIINLFVLVTLLALAFGDSAAAVSSLAAHTGSQPYAFKSVHTGGGGGYIVDVIFNPTEQNLIYAKTDVGGAYRWEPATQTWKQLLNWVSTDDWNWSGVESLATDPVDPNNLYLAVGTYVNDSAQTNGAILRSSDKGETFTRVDMPFKMGSNMNGRGMGERLAVDPNANNILYFGARDGNGLWKSDDYGATWTHVANFPDPGTFVAVTGDSSLGYAVGIPWIIFDKTSGTAGSPTPNIYVGVATNSSGAPNIYRSTDAGATWEAVPGQPTCTGVWGATVTCTGGATWTAAAENSYTGGGLGYLPHSAKFDSAGTLYITYSDWEGPYNGSHGDVWKFVPSTSTWTLISPVPGYDTSTNYFGYGGLAVDLQNPGTLMVTAVNSWWPQGQMWRSTDSGTTWRAAWTWGGWPNTNKIFSMDITNAPWLNFGKVEEPPVPAVNIGWMMEGFNIDPFDSNRAMYGTGATLYEITGLNDPTDGDKWMAGSGVVIKSQAVGIEETIVNGLVSPPTGTAHLFSVMEDVSGFRHDDLDTAPAVMYTVPYAGTYNAIDFAENNPQFLVRAGRGDRTMYYPLNLDTAFTTDGGATWVPGPTNISGATGGGTIAAAADASRVVWAPVGGEVSYSTDMGGTWIASTGGIPNGAIIASDRVNANKFYAFSGGTVYVSTDGGVSFTATVTGLPTSGQIKAAPGLEGEVWVAANEMDASHNPVAGDGIYHSTDSGATFTKLTSWITYADVIGFGMHSPSNTYPAIFTSAEIDGYRTIYRSDDMGASWIKITDAQHQYATTLSLTGDPRIYGRVYIGTKGLGIIYGDTAGNLVLPPLHTVTYAHNPAGGTGILPTQADVFTGDTFAVASGAGLTRANYNFAGWNDGSNTYQSGDIYAMGGNDVTLTAQWTATHTVTYDLNGGTGTTPTQADVAEGASFTVADGAGFSNAGFTFNGWKDQSNASYAAGSSYTMSTSNVTLTAQWNLCPSTITVTSNADSGPNTLRQAIAEVCADRTINFSGDMTILLESELAIGKNLTIDGGLHNITVSGNHVTHVFNVTDGTVVFNHLTITDGNAQDCFPGSYYAKCGGGLNLLNNSAINVTVTNSTFSGNSAGDTGGGISNYGATLTVTNSTFIGNSSRFGGAIATWDPGKMTVANSTFVGNSGIWGSAILHYGTLMSVTNSTIISDNPGSYNTTFYPYGRNQTMTNTVIVRLGVGEICADSLGGTNNLTNRANYCGAGFTTSDSILPGTLGDYGGLTQTVPLLPGSSAIDAGNSATCAGASVNSLDQRGVARPSACDIGAFESQGFTLTKTASSDNQSAMMSTAFANPLEVTVSSSHSEPVDGGQVTFTAVPGSSGQNASLATSPATIGAVTSGKASVDATANGTAGSYTVTASANGAASQNFSLTNLGLNTYTVTFHANGGTGTMAPQTASAPTALKFNTFTRAGYLFTGWNTAANGSGTAYADGATYGFAADVTLYAQWKATVKNNLLLKPDFGGAYVMPYPWSAIGVQPPFTSILDCNILRSKPCSVRLIGGKGVNITILQKVKLAGKAGDTFSFGLSNRTSNVPSTSGRFQVEVLFYDSWNKIVGTSVLKLPSGSHNWTVYNAIATAPADYTHMVFRFIYQKTGGTAWFDDAFLSK
jgi:uncharacterized repeat protein (TIGR02543 family)